MNQDWRKRSPTGKPSDVPCVLNCIKEERDLYRLIHRLAFDSVELEVITELVTNLREKRK